MHRLVRILFSIVMFVPPAMLAQPASVSGLITSDTTWTLSGSPVTVLSTVTIPNGITLTIQSGVSVKFDTNTALIVAGKILAEGVTFTSVKQEFVGTAALPGQDTPLSPMVVYAAPGDWYGIEFQNTANIGSVFKSNSVKFAGGGPNGANIFYKTGAYGVEIRDCFIARSQQHGINTRASSPLIHNSIVTGNTGFGVFSDLLSNFIVDSSDITYNTAGGLRVPTNSTPVIKNTNINDNGIGIFIDNGATPNIQNNIIQYNATGIQFTGIGAGQPTITNNEIKFNSAWGFLNTSTSATVIAEHNFWGTPGGPYNPFSNPTGTGNAVSERVDYIPWKTQQAKLPVVNIAGAASLSKLYLSTLWPDTVYRITASTVIASPLTIRPGTIVKVNAGLYVQITGAVTAVGTQDSLIVFTSDKDDSYGGDTDSSATQPAAGNWSRLEINGAGANATELKYVLIKYAGTGSGNLRLESTSPKLSYIYTINSSTYGLYANASATVLDNVVSTGNASNGYDINNGSLVLRSCTAAGNGGSGVYADGSAVVNIAQSRFTNNGAYGVQVMGSPAILQTLDSCVISFNAATGVYQNLGTTAQRFSYNRVEGNASNGFWVNNTADSVLFLADTVMNNVQDGIVTTKANLLGNMLSGNRYPIALIGNVNTRYNGNTITGNTYNNAVGLRLNGAEFYDTLRAQFPAGMVSKTYVLIENANSGGIANGKTLVIEPGVVWKFSFNTYMNIDGTLIANGTPSSKIVFTSYRDSTYGGKTNLLNDFSKPAPNDWRYIQLYAASANSRFSHCLFKFGGQDGYGMIYANTVTFTDTLDNLTFLRSGSYGMRMYRCNGIIENTRIDSNTYSGLYITGTSPGSDITVRTCTVQDNGGAGLYADPGSAFREVSNCIIQRNATHGIVIDNGHIPQTYLGNTVRFNLIDGFHLYNPNLAPTNVQLIGNTISDNGSIGSLTTAAQYIDNTFERNNYPLGVWGKMGNLYTDNSNADGNIISQNTFNKAIAIVGSAIWDTIRADFPDSMTSKTFHIIDNINVPSGDTLVVQPGINLKFFYKNSGTYSVEFDVYGTLIAEGTPEAPIIFTSWRDSTAGGKTTPASDTLGPIRGHWNYIAFRNGSGNSRIRNSHFRYGGDDQYQTVYFETNLSTLQFARNRVEFSDGNGITVYNTSIVLDSVVLADNDNSGVWVQSNTNALLHIKNSFVYNNGSHGIFKENTGKLGLVDRCLIYNNAGNGIDAYNNTIPLIVSNSSVHHNTVHGIYVDAKSNPADTMLLLLNNKIYANTVAGVMSSRAYFVSDSIYGNRYAVGLTGELSLSGTGNALGNVYADNAFYGNQYDGVLAVEGYVEGKLGFSYPNGFTTNVFAMRGNLEISAGDTLHIAPGSVVKFSKEWGSSRIYVYGTLLSVGQENNKIVYTSWSDDTFGGDTNKDTSATIPQPGDWWRVYVNGTGSSNTVFKNSILRYGGLNGYAMLELNSSNALVESSYVSYGSYIGLHLNNSSSTVFANEIHHNSIGIYINGTSSAVINYNNIYLNTTGMETYYPGAVVNAENNYWGAATGPLKTTGANQNPTGQGNRIYVSGTGDVDYQPYLTARQGILYGDVSGNGQISAFDASLVLQHDVEMITLNPVQKLAANVNGDTLVNAFDASYILRYVVGLISGFPGLGKMSMESDVFSAFSFSVEKASEPGQFDLLIGLNKPVNVFSSSIGLQFDTLLVKPLSMSRGAASDSMSLVHYFPSGKANIALAGVYPLNTPGEIARFRFALLNEGKAQESILFTVKKFFLNDRDVTSEAGTIILNVADVAQVPTVFALEQNYPNPFNPSTTIKYQLPEASTVHIAIYNVLGQHVRTMLGEYQSPGFYSLQWNGTDDNGLALSSGMYLYRIDAVTGTGQRFVNTKKMLLVK